MTMLLENAHLKQMLLGNTFKVVVFTDIWSGSVSKDIYNISCCLELEQNHQKAVASRDTKNCPTETKYIKRSKVMKKALEIVVMQK